MEALKAKLGLLAQKARENKGLIIRTSAVLVGAAIGMAVASIIARNGSDEELEAEYLLAEEDILMGEEEEEDEESEEEVEEAE